jgi:predicted AlkP superfamily phosphohydrolase/phosphomutase
MKYLIQQGLSVLFIVFGGATVAQAYIGPGAGFAFISSFFVIAATFFLAAVSMVSWPLRALLIYLKRKKINKRTKVRRVIVIGFDGLDPKLCRNYMQEGKLPNLKRMTNNGSFRPLQTTIPSISPVAWSTFATGVNPGKHRIYDFLTCDFKRYLPVLSSVRISSIPRIFKMGPFKRFFGQKPLIKLLRKSTPVWNILGKHKLFSAILRVPITFPPEKFYGVCLSAMCTPDLRGTQGSFTLLTTQSNRNGDRESKGEIVRIKIEKNQFIGHIAGPSVKRKGSEQVLKTKIHGCINPERQEVRLTVGSQSFRLVQDQYSPWIKLTFSAGPFRRISGMARFLLVQWDPYLKIYMTPIHIDPDKPSLPISHPFSYAGTLAKLHGAYATLGLAEDTWALNEGIIDEKAFLEHSYQIFEERKILLLDHLRRNRDGLTTLVFDTTDRIQHMFFRYLSEDHPANKNRNGNHPQAIEEVYTRTDDLVGLIMEKIDPQDLLMIISDHGFKPFKWGVNLNTWLWKEGYLAFINDQPMYKEWFKNVDWTRTRAYAFGLSGIYLNTRGREKNGIVRRGKEMNALAEEIKAKLEAFEDKDRDKNPIRRVFLAHQCLHGPYVEDAPQLMIGYESGYRASWNSAMGKVSKSVIEPNDRCWSGDHCIDPDLVPGVFFSNWILTDDSPALVDIAPTILDMFGLDKPSFHDGVVLGLKPPPSGQI